MLIRRVLRSLHCHPCWIRSAIALGTIAAGSDRAIAQNITLDGSLGLVKTLTGPNYVIPQSAGQTVGSNLFHSFGKFSLNAGEVAGFSSAANIQNILSRVTGGSPSLINGSIFTDQPVNFFLINPSGIHFGPKAQLNVGSTTRGSFVATTLDALVWADGSQFSATNPEGASSLLTMVGDPSGFISSQLPKPIVGSASTLKVAENQTLLLLGGDVSWKGGLLQARSGRVELAGVAEPGTVKLNVEGNRWRLKFLDSVVQADISLTNQAAIDVSSQGSGAIQLSGRQVTFSDESKVSANTLGNRNGQGIFIQAVRLTIQGGSQVSATTSGKGKGGSIDINVSDSVELIGTSADGQKPSKLASDVKDAAGDAGNVTITTRQLLVRDGARISASGSGTGQGGSINVYATDRVELSGTAPSDRRPSGLSVQTSRGNGKAGNLTITTRKLTIRNGAEVSAATFGAGFGGNLEVNASELVELVGTSGNGKLRSRLFAGTGNPADVIRDGDGSPSDSSNLPAFSTGDGGSLTVKTQLLTVRDRGQISVGSQGLGKAGELEIDSGSILLDNGATLNAQTVSGDGGNIRLRVQDLLLLRRNSNLSTTAGTAKAGGDGGNLDINAKFIVAVPSENSDITANAFQGRGGSINITTSSIFGSQLRSRPTSQSDITASSEFGVDGTVQINTLDVDPSRGLATLPAELVDASGLVAQTCPASGSNVASSFTVTGSGGLPDNPSETRTSNAVWTDWRQVAPASTHSQKDVAIQSNLTKEPVEAQGWVENDRGEVVLTAAVPYSSLHSGLTTAKCYVP
ncbi:filamentous hemagglutinin N-terminal domain-containing protein [Coleofasciculus sp. FACHB-T130]|uniref:two-partner secretion domain-containing protein n=1 Tax=Cyanophyceae TaxID=3028117 RepID=UPI0016839093|nr:filamentous hemagglutinin N-terminal domain-containing protein [Coleofasciculus sp. FACHB-T130]